MDKYFTFNKYVTGAIHVGRVNEARALANLLVQRENVVISEPPKSGKQSLVRQTFLNMKASGADFVPVIVDLMSLRSVADFVKQLSSELLKSFWSTPAEYADAAANLLGSTHLVFDANSYQREGEVVSLNWDVDSNDLRAAVSLARRISESKGKRVYVLLLEFQNVMLTEDGDGILSAFEDVLGEGPCDAGFVFCGSRIKAMSRILREHYRFRKCCERLRLPEIDARLIIDHIIRGFNSTGKVTERDLLLGVCKLFRGNMFYINHFCSICDALSRGYIMDSVLTEALGQVISVHQPRFLDMIYDLTSFQLRFLKAILDGHTKFSSTEIIEQYKLNSSANVLRLKEALCRKEIVYFDDAGVPHIIDPLFEYWVRTAYFGMKI